MCGPKSRHTKVPPSLNMSGVRYVYSVIYFTVVITNGESKSPLTTIIDRSYSDHCRCYITSNNVTTTGLYEYLCVRSSKKIKKKKKGDGVFRQYFITCNLRQNKNI